MAVQFTVVIGSFLEKDLVERIAAAPPVARVIYEPELLPVPRYPCDHMGQRRELRAAELDRWRALGATADVYCGVTDDRRRGAGTGLDGSRHQRSLPQPTIGA
jgi:hypothetical protein